MAESLKHKKAPANKRLLIVQNTKDSTSDEPENKKFVVCYLNIACFNPSKINNSTDLEYIKKVSLIKAESIDTSIEKGKPFSPNTSALLLLPRSGG